VELKECRYCKKSFPEDAFGVALTTPSKIFRRRKCRDCYRTTKLTLANKYLKWINQQKQAQGCKRCGAKDPRVLDFHHTDDKNKLFSIGTFRRAVGFEQIQKEVEKCEVVCANCHRILHDELRKVEKYGL
jgi:hypothetical protein